MYTSYSIKLRTAMLERGRVFAPPQLRRISLSAVHRTMQVREVAYPLLRHPTPDVGRACGRRLYLYECTIVHNTWFCPAVEPDESRKKKPRTN